MFAGSIGTQGDLDLSAHKARSVFRIDLGDFLLPINIILIESVYPSTAEIVTS